MEERTGATREGTRYRRVGTISSAAPVMARLWDLVESGERERTRKQTGGQKPSR